MRVNAKYCLSFSLVICIRVVFHPIWQNERHARKRGAEMVLMASCRQSDLASLAASALPRDLLNARRPGWLEHLKLGSLLGERFVLLARLLLPVQQLISAMEQASSSTGGRARLDSHDQVPVISTIDDAVSLIRSIEATPENASSGAVSLAPTQIHQILLPALKKQFHSQKGKGQRLFTQALQGGIDPLSMLDPARNSLGYAYIL